MRFAALVLLAGCRAAAIPVSDGLVNIGDRALHLHCGINVRLFASDHPGSVAGMVLVDTTVDPLANGSEAHVLTAGQPNAAAGSRTPWQDLQEELPRLSTNSAHVTATNCHHFLQWEAPDLVVAAVREVVLAARTHGRVGVSSLTALANEPARMPP